MHFGLKSLNELPPLEEFEETFGSDSAEPAEGGERLESRDAIESYDVQDADMASDLHEALEAGTETAGEVESGRLEET